jgi:actin-related protein
MSTPPQGSPVILDIGSAYVKVGFAGEPDPRYIFPCITGKRKYKSVMVDTGSQMHELYVGDAAMNLRGVLNLNHPIERGVITDWDEYYEILNHAFYNLLRINNTQNHPIIYIESISEQNDIREYIARVLFETHQFHSIFMVPSPILSSFSVGLITALVIESGDGVTWIVPIIKGKIIYQAIQRLDLAGIDINHNLESLLMREGITITSSGSSEILRQIKEEYCHFVLDPDNPSKVGEKVKFPLPDGSIIEISPHILYEAPEVMFDPSMIGSNSPSLPEAIIKCLRSVDKPYWGDLLTHIVLSGGNFLQNGFKERLELELSSSLSEFGPIPKAHKIETEKQLKILRPVKGAKKVQDTCPKCGAHLDLSDGKTQCPECGASLQTTQIDIKIKDQSSLKCPLCNKVIEDKTSLFCPYCGHKLQKDKSNESTSSAQVQDTLEYIDSSSKVLHFFIPNNLQAAIFNGASILGSLPSFNQLFITQAEFQENREILSRDISEIFSFQS